MSSDGEESRCYLSEGCNMDTDEDIDAPEEGDIDIEMDRVRDELGKALADTKSNKTVYYVDNPSFAPNPCLDVNGLGTLGLPLNSRDAEAIIKVVKPASGPDTSRMCCVYSDQVQFRNSEWLPFIENSIMPTILEGLGLEKGPTLPRLQFSCLVVYGLGSREHPLCQHQKERTNLAFGSVMMVLPSEHEGGEIEFTHGAGTQLVNFSKDSLTKTSIIAWYTNVAQEMRPITAGFRLALIYDLIHCGDPESIPRAPNLDHVVEATKATLARWLQLTSSQETHSQDFLVCLLTDRRKNIRLDSGIGAMLCTVAREMGFLVFSGPVNYVLSGEGNGGCFDDIEDKELTLENLVDVDGKPVMGSALWHIDEEHLVPRDPFESMEPDHKDYEAYSRKISGAMSWSYKRTGLLLVHRNHVNAVFFQVTGLEYLLSKLKDSDSVQLTKDDEKIVIDTVQAIDVDPEVDHSDGHTYRELISQALRWSSAGVWKAALLKYNENLDKLDKKMLIDAKGSFTFEDLEPCFQELLRKEQPLSARMKFISNVGAVFVDYGNIKFWCKEARVQAYCNFVDPRQEDIRYLLNAAQQFGGDFLCSRVLPSLANSDTFDFILAFVDRLYPNPKSNWAQTSKATDTTSGWDDLIDDCLNLAIDKIDIAELAPEIARPLPNPMNNLATPASCAAVNRLISVCTRCISLGRNTPWTKITDVLLSIPGDPVSLFSTVYSPLVSSLVPSCRKSNVEVTAPPVARLLRLLIKRYMHHVLGTPPALINKIKKVGCGCRDCNAIDRFIVNTNMKQWSVQLKEDKTQGHFDSRLEPAQDILTYSVIAGEPPTLRILKRPETLVADKWHNRIPDAKKFLGIIGNDATIARLMGDRYTDVQRLLQGQPPSKSFKTKTRTPESLTTTVPGNDNSDAKSTKKVAGQKRKRGSSGFSRDLGIIDLAD